MAEDGEKSHGRKSVQDRRWVTSKVNINTLFGTVEYDQVVRPKYRPPLYGKARSANLMARTDRTDNRKECVIQSKINRPPSCETSKKQTPHIRNNETVFSKEIKDTSDTGPGYVNERSNAVDRKTHRKRLWDNTTLNRHFLENLLIRKPEHVGKVFSERYEDFVQVMKNCSKDGYVINVLLRLFAKIASNCSESIMTLNTALHESLFIENNVVSYLISLLGRGCENIDAVRNALQLITCMANNSVNSIVGFYSVLTVLSELVEELRASDVCSHKIMAEIEDFDQIRSQILTIRRRADKKKKTKEDMYRPPDDFRTVSVVPTATELLTNKQPFLRKNKAYGSYNDTEHYLDIQFRLLREDYIAPLRESIQEYKTNFQEIQKGTKRIRDIRVYSGVHIAGTTVTADGIGQLLTFDTSSTQRVNWEHSKRLNYGSLLCLSHDNFSTIWFAVVTNREVEDLQLGIVEVQFTCGMKPLYAFADNEFLMAESDTYFEAYRHNLLALQSIKTLPFSNYIVNCQERIDAPAYLLKDESITYDLNLLANENIKFQIKDSDRIELANVSGTTKINNEINPKEMPQKIQIIRDPTLNNVAVLAERQWPTPSSIGLDDSQFRALKNALSHEFSITQGPPGTGKTYVGLKIAKGLLANKNAWSDKDSLQPMLIVCYTNHALDQFLCGICEFFSGKIVRVGGRSSSELMQKHGIKTMYRLISDEVLEEASVLRDIKNKTEERIDEIKNELRMADERPLRESQLRKNVGRLYRSLKFGFGVQVFEINRNMNRKRQLDRNMCRQRELQPDQFDVIEEWLGRGRLVKQSKFQVYFRDIDKGNLAKTNQLLQENGKDSRLEDSVSYFYQHINCVSKDGLKKKQIEAKKTVSQAKEKKAKSKKEIVHKDSVYYDEILPATDRFQMGIHGVWTVPVSQRWKLYKKWVEEYKLEQKKRLKEYEEDYEMICQQMKAIIVETNSLALRQADVVGMTTIGAAKHFDILQAVKPRIVIVEEAAEVLEANIVTSLSEQCEHLILISDHKQLKPSPAVYKLGKKFNLDISLFERMINNKVKYECLEFQHRMRPEISKLIRLFYPTLKDDQSVLNRPKIKGVESNVFFISHSCEEVTDEDSTSHSNEHEANFLVAFCRYLLKQDYKPSQITVLTTYSAQMFLLRRMMPKDSEFHGVNVTVVDNYQGEENDIILLSLVRSNPDEKIGFLKIENRVNVALSRARNGLFVIGNFEIISRVSDVWSAIINLLKEENQTGPSLPLFCRNHRDSKLFASSADDFLLAPEGGCYEDCDARLDCGHVCRLKCHVYDTNHEAYQCEAPCNKTCSNDHKCVDLCYETCSDCKVRIPKEIPKCGHMQEIPCYKDPALWKCQMPCEDTLDCGHKCQCKCYEEDHICRKRVEVPFESCGHIMVVNCYQKSETIHCKMPCEFLLDCQHKCIEKCHQPHTKRCQNEITKVLKCGHSVLVHCYEDPNDIKCPLPCEESLVCGHRCKALCGEEHTIFCDEPVEKKLICGHLLSLFCSENIGAVKCPHECRKKLECGHMCENKCSEPHTEKCLVSVTHKCIYGHKTQMQCYAVFQQVVVECTVQCRRKLACGHSCRGSCFECENGRFHKPCFVCGLPDKQRHSDISGRGRKIPCVAPCRDECSHRKCMKMCFEPCADDRTTSWPCKEKCEWSCEHKTCSKLCFEQCDRSICRENCNKRVGKCTLLADASNACQGYCGETCGVSSWLELRRLGSSRMCAGIERKTFHKSCGKVLDIDSLQVTRPRGTYTCGPVCLRCKEPMLLDEKAYGNTAKKIHEQKERMKLQSAFYERHIELQRLFDMVRLNVDTIEPENHKRNSFVSIFEKCHRSFEKFLHFQAQGYKDLKKELQRLLQLVEDSIAKQYTVGK